MTVFSIDRDCPTQYNRCKLYKTILARGERKRESSFQKKEPIFLSRNAVFLLALRRDAFHLAIIRRLG